MTLDLRVTQIATDAEPMELTDYMYTVGSGSITEGVDELILGLSAGEELKLNGSLGAGSWRPTSSRSSRSRSESCPS